MILHGPVLGIENHQGLLSLICETTRHYFEFSSSNNHGSGKWMNHGPKLETKLIVHLKFNHIFRWSMTVEGWVTATKLLAMITYRTTCLNTLPKTNIAPENGWLEDKFSYWDGLFSREYVSFTRGYPHPKKTHDLSIQTFSSKSRNIEEFLGKRSLNMTELIWIQS